MNRFMPIAGGGGLLIAVVMIMAGCSERDASSAVAQQQEHQQERQESLAAPRQDVSQSGAPPAGGQNNQPHLLVDYTWRVEHSKKPGSKVTCGDPECLNVGDYFKVIALDKIIALDDNATTTGLRLLLITNSMQDGAVYDFRSKQSNVTKVGGNVTHLDFTFDDNVSGPPVERRMCLTPVRLKNRMNDSRKACIESLKGRDGEFFSRSERTHACGHTNLVHWEIVPGSDSCPRVRQKDVVLGPLGHPEAGQGTGSGGNN